MRLYALVVLAFLVACGGASTADETAATVAHRLQAFAMDPFETPIGDWGIDQNALALIAARFGAPMATDVVAIPDRTSDAMLNEHVIDYDGVRFRVGESESGDRSWIMVTEITGNAFPMKFGLAIGSTRDDVERVFEPEPSAVPRNPLVLTATTNPELPDLATWEGGTIDVMMTFAADRLTKVVVVSSVL